MLFVAEFDWVNKKRLILLAKNSSKDLSFSCNIGGKVVLKIFKMDMILNKTNLDCSNWTSSCWSSGPEKRFATNSNIESKNVLWVILKFIFNWYWDLEVVEVSGLQHLQWIM